jgi:hypothetical protein
MHTWATDDGWRLHHDGGFDGDVVINWKTSETTYNQHRTTSEWVLKVVRRDWRPGYPDRQYLLAGSTCKGEPVELAVPLSLLVSFVADRYVRRGLEEVLQGDDDDLLMRLLPAMDEVKKIRKG